MTNPVDARPTRARRDRRPPLRPAEKCACRALAARGGSGAPFARSTKLELSIPGSIAMLSCALPARLRGPDRGLPSYATGPPRWGQAMASKRFKSGISPAQYRAADALFLMEGAVYDASARRIGCM